MNQNLDYRKILSPNELKDHSLSSRVLKLTTLSEDGTGYRHASGFIIKYSNTLYLYTCWHVVTGIDFFAPEDLPKSLPIPRSIRVTGVNIYMNGSLPAGSGHERSFEFPLYSKDGIPVWQQNNNNLREHYALNKIGIKLPKDADVIRLKIQLPPEIATSWAIDIKRHIHWSFPQLFEPAIISGYPYGYSASISSPTPIFLKRYVASWITDNVNKTILDGVGVKGMSGGPVWSLNNKLLGMYRGEIYPDYNPKSSEKNDRHAALGLMSTSNILLDYGREEKECHYT